QAGSSVGTPGYMAPEQVAGDTLDNRVDIYAWGMLAYELLAGAHPFADKTRAAQIMAAQVSQVPAPLSTLAPDVPPYLAQLITRCLAKIPEERPSSAAEIARRLDTIGESAEQPVATLITKQRRFPVTAAAAV